jgi:hypothetical protein
LIVGDDEKHGKPPHASDVEGLGNIAFRGGAVAEDRNRDTRLAPQLEGEGDAGGVRRVAADGDADREILARPGEVAAALVAAPIEQQLQRRHAAPELRPMLAKARQQHILAAHGAGDADRHRLLTERGSVGAKTAGALERDCLGVESPGAHHAAIKPRQLGRVLRNFWQRARRPPVRGEITDKGHVAHAAAPRRCCREARARPRSGL